MSVLDLFRKSRLKTPTIDGVRPKTYQESAIQARNVRFPATILPGTTFESYIKVASNGALPIPPPPTIFFITTETSDFLTTESGDDLVADQEY